MLFINNLTKTFGGLRAVSEVTFQVKQGEVVGLIGPNGAGKTTLFNLISGFITPTSGDITFHDERLNKLKPFQICKMGIGRTFQIVQPFPDISTRDNVMVGAFLHTANRGLAEKKSLEALERVRLAHKKDEKAKNLTLLELKQLEIAKALATNPQLLLLDEVAAGLNLSEIDQIMKLVHELNIQGITILMIEHVMKLIMGLSNRIVVLNFGRKIAEDSPDKIINNPEVIEAYLGKEESIA
ncbi:MAG: ABC transporter ATP-binding protein [Candidatus Kryptoniota bacterium]